MGLITDSQRPQSCRLPPDLSVGLHVGWRDWKHLQVSRDQMNHTEWFTNCVRHARTKMVRPSCAFYVCSHTQKFLFTDGNRIRTRNHMTCCCTCCSSRQLNHTFTTARLHPPIKGACSRLCGEDGRMLVISEKVQHTKHMFSRGEWACILCWGNNVFFLSDLRESCLT